MKTQQLTEREREREITLIAVTNQVLRESTIALTNVLCDATSGITQAKIM